MKEKPLLVYGLISVFHWNTEESWGVLEAKWRILNASFQKGLKFHFSQWAIIGCFSRWSHLASKLYVRQATQDCCYLNYHTIFWRFFLFWLIVLNEQDWIKMIFPVFYIPTHPNVVLYFLLQDTFHCSSEEKKNNQSQYRQHTRDFILASKSNVTSEAGCSKLSESQEEHQTGPSFTTWPQSSTTINTGLYDLRNSWLSLNFSNVVEIPVPSSVFNVEQIRKYNSLLT